jgi:hypothetical protein
MAISAILNITQGHLQRKFATLADKNHYKLKYNISYKDNEKDKQINFHSENNMITYLNKNTNYLNTLNHVCLNFKQIKIALSQSRWRIKK